MLFPSRDQWRSWSLPSKLTAVGAYVSILGILLTVGIFAFQIYREARTDPQVARTAHTPLSVERPTVQSNVRVPPRAKTEDGKTDVENRTIPTEEGVEPQDTAVLGSRERPLSIVPDDLTRFYARPELTHVQSDALLAPYVGKWIVVSGKIRDIFASGPGQATIYLNLDKSRTPLASLRFSGQSQASAVLLFPKGSRITAIGKIQAAAADFLILHDCQLRSE
jgi:hypothetical protein